MGGEWRNFLQTGSECVGVPLASATVFSTSAADYKQKTERPGPRKQPTAAENEKKLFPSWSSGNSASFTERISCDALRRTYWLGYV